MKKLTILILLLMLATFPISAQAGPPTPPTLDANIVNEPTVHLGSTAHTYVVNTESDPVPVTMINGTNSQRTPWQKQN